jgi:serine phosphatase RsbU (regulator of sigma subunit)
MKKCFALIFLFMQFFCYANRKTDSLITKLQKSKTDTNKVNLYSKIAREFLYMDAAKALSYADSGEILGKKLNYQRGVCRAYIVKGIYYRNSGDYNNGFKYQFDAIKIAEKIKDKKLIASGYTNLGILFKNQGNYKKAIEYHLQSKQKYTELGDKMGVANCYQNMSNTYRRDKQPDKAIESSREAFKLFDEQNDQYGRMSAYASMGSVYMEDKKEYGIALNYFLKARKISEDENDINGKTVSYQNLGNCYFFLKNYKLAEEFSKKSVELGISLGNKEQEAANYQNLSAIYEATGNTKQALLYHKLFHELSDSVAKSRYKQSTLELEEKFQSEKSKKEIELLSNLNELQIKENDIQKSQLKKNKIILFCAFIIGLIIASLAFLFYKNFKKTEKLNSLLTNRNSLIEYQKKEILDSILYARRIQDSILPQTDELQKALPKHFVIYKPRDIVSGDFYWTCQVKQAGPKNNPLTILALCDCTGHGVPGAFMSLISYTLLNHIVKDPKTNAANTVLDFLARELPITLKSVGTAQDLRDGLDIAVAAIDFTDLTLQCSMAHIPIYICDGKELKFIQPDKQSISADNYDPGFKFSLHEVQLKKGDRIYFSTDGFADQFGGPKGKKLKYKELEKFLFETHHLPLHEQKIKLEDFFMTWKAGLEQVDDVTLIGLEM